MTSRTASALLLGMLLSAPWLPAQQQPVFRATSTHVMVDVVVTDKDGRAVKGLTAKDFIVRARGKEQAITDVEHISIPFGHRSGSLNPPPSASPTMFTNAPPPKDSRVFVFMIGHISPARIVPTKRMLSAFVSALAPNDIVAVSYNGRSDLSQDFTNDHSLIARAFSNVSAASEIIPSADRPSRWFRNVLFAFNSDRHPRRAIVYVSEGAPFRKADPDDMQFTALQDEMNRAVRFNIPIYTIDPRGLMAPDLALEGTLEEQTPERRKGINQAIFASKQGLKVIAENTNGLAFTDNLNVEDAARSLLRGNNNYYLLGFYPEPPSADGTFDAFDVQVRVSGATVRSRQGYTSVDSAAAKAALNRIDALTASLPGGELSLQGTITPVSVERGLVTTRLGVTVLYPALNPAPTDGDRLSVRWVAVDADGKVQASGQRIVTVAGSQFVGTPFSVSIEESLELPQGRLTIRAAVSSAAAGTQGWLHIPIAASK